MGTSGNGNHQLSTFSRCSLGFWAMASQLLDFKRPVLKPFQAAVLIKTFLPIWGQEHGLWGPLCIWLQANIMMPPPPCFIYEWCYAWMSSMWLFKILEFSLKLSQFVSSFSFKCLLYVFYSGKVEDLNNYSFIFQDCFVLFVCLFSLSYKPNKMSRKQSESE